VSQPPRYGVVARASAAGILFPVSIVAGYLLGKWIGAALGLGQTPAFIGAALGVAAGFWNLYRLVRGIEDDGKPR
jgi:Putative F0F1-ATPase subunit Ca2+/Mg2+ transporter